MIPTYSRPAVFFGFLVLNFVPVQILGESTGPVEAPQSPADQVLIYRIDRPSDETPYEIMADYIGSEMTKQSGLNLQVSFPRTEGSFDTLLALM
jgi:hypothetical protein